jgi:hypothetical protein
LTERARGAVEGIEAVRPLLDERAAMLKGLHGSGGRAVPVKTASSPAWGWACVSFLGGLRGFYIGTSVAAFNGTWIGLTTRARPLRPGGILGDRMWRRTRLSVQSGLGPCIPDSVIQSRNFSGGTTSARMRTVRPAPKRASWASSQ